MSFFEPFTKIEEVEPYYNHYVECNGKLYKVIGASLRSFHSVWITIVDEDGNEFEDSALGFFYKFHYNGHQFGKEMNFEED